MDAKEIENPKKDQVFHAHADSGVATIGVKNEPFSGDLGAVIH
jgi:hypothetical protein